jgi:hypothetical protein
MPPDAQAEVARQFAANAQKIQNFQGAGGFAPEGDISFPGGSYSLGDTNLTGQLQKKLAEQQQAKTTAAPTQATPTSATTPAAANPSVAAGAQPINPLAANLYYSTSVAPMMSNLANQLMNSNQQFAQMAQNNPMAKYMPPQFQALFNQQIPRMGAQQNDLVASMINSAQNAPKLDELMKEVNAAHQSAVQDYEKQLYLESAGLAGAGNPFGTTTTPGGQPQTAQQIVDAATQKMATG